jgi:hypothetical protein
MSPFAEPGSSTHGRHHVTQAPGYNAAARMSRSMIATAACSTDSIRSRSPARAALPARQSSPALHRIGDRPGQRLGPIQITCSGTITELATGHRRSRRCASRLGR